MGFIIALCVLIAFTIVPVMLAAKMLNASNTGFWPCVFAVVLSSVAAGFVSQFVSGEALYFVVSFAISAVIFSAILGAKYIQSACIALVALVIQYGSIFVLGLLGLSLAA